MFDRKDFDEKTPFARRQVGADLPPRDAGAFFCDLVILVTGGSCVSDAGLLLPVTAQGLTLLSALFRRTLCDAVADRTHSCGGPAVGAAVGRDVKWKTPSHAVPRTPRHLRAVRAGESVSLTIRFRARGGRAYDAGIPPLLLTFVWRMTWPPNLCCRFCGLSLVGLSPFAVQTAFGLPFGLTLPYRTPPIEAPEYRASYHTCWPNSSPPFGDAFAVGVHAFACEAGRTCHTFLPWIGKVG